MEALNANAINSILWMGRLEANGEVNTIGSGVAIRHRGIPLLVTAKHVVGATASAPPMVLRYNGSWNPVSMGVIAEDDDMDIIVLNREWVLADLDPVPMGNADTMHGTLGRALGFPMMTGGLSLDEMAATIGEVNGRPIPIPALVTSAIAAGSGESQYASGYVNSGFSGGGVFYPVNAGANAAVHWSLVGIITERGAIQKHVEVMIGGERHLIVQMEPTGLVKFAKIASVLDLIDRNLPSR